MSINNPRTTKKGRLPRFKIAEYDVYGYHRDIDAIMDIYLKFHPNHNLREISSYIAGYFYRRHANHIKEMNHMKRKLDELGATK